MKKYFSCMVFVLGLCISMPHMANAESTLSNLKGMPVVDENNYKPNTPEAAFITMKKIFQDSVNSITNHVEDEKAVQAIEQRLLNAVEKIAQQGLNAGMNGLQAYSQAFSEGALMGAKTLSTIIAQQDSKVKNSIVGCYILHDPQRVGYAVVQNTMDHEDKPLKTISVMVWKKDALGKWGSGSASAKSDVGETFTTTSIAHLHDYNPSADIQWNITIKDGVMTVQTPKAFKDGEEYMSAAWNEDFVATELEPDGVYVFSTSK